MAMESDPNREAESQRYLVMGAELITWKFRGGQYSVFERRTHTLEFRWSSKHVRLRSPSISTNTLVSALVAITSS